MLTGIMLTEDTIGCISDSVTFRLPVANCLPYLAILYVYIHPESAMASKESHWEGVFRAEHPSTTSE